MPDHGRECECRTCRPVYRSTKHKSVYVRHEKGCPAAEADGPRCRCRPSYRARHRQHGHSPTFKDINEAIGWLADVKRGRVAKAVERPHELTFRAVSEQWWAAIESGSIGTRKKRRAYKPNTLRQYRVALDMHVLPEMGDRPAALLTIRDWQHFLDHLRAKGLKTNSINNYINPVRAIYGWACSPVRQILPANATSGLELPPSDETARTRVATPAEMRTLIAAVREDDQPVWALAAFAGLRSLEIDGCDWSKVDWEQGGIYVPDSKSEAGVRWVPMVAPLRTILRAAWMRQGKPAAGRVAVGSIKAAKDRALGQRTKGRKGAWEKAGLVPIGLHECRHTYISYMHAAGVPQKVQANISGHEDEAITLKRYTHVMPGALREATVLLDAYLEASG